MKAPTTLTTPRALNALSENLPPFFLAMAAPLERASLGTSTRKSDTINAGVRYCAPLLEVTKEKLALARTLSTKKKGTEDLLLKCKDLVNGLALFSIRTSNTNDGFIPTRCTPPATFAPLTEVELQHFIKTRGSRPITKKEVNDAFQRIGRKAHGQMDIAARLYMKEFGDCAEELMITTTQFLNHLIHLFAAEPNGHSVQKKTKSTPLTQVRGPKISRETPSNVVAEITKTVQSLESLLTPENVQQLLDMNVVNMFGLRAKLETIPPRADVSAIDLLLRLARFGNEEVFSSQQNSSELRLRCGDIRALALERLEVLTHTQEARSKIVEVLSPTLVQCMRALFKELPFAPHITPMPPDAPLPLFQQNVASALLHVSPFTYAKHAIELLEHLIKHFPSGPLNIRTLSFLTPLISTERYGCTHTSLATITKLCITLGELIAKYDGDLKMYGNKQLHGAQDHLTRVANRINRMTSAQRTPKKT